MSVLSPLRAQVEAEVKTRLRSTATLLAVAGLFAASFLWIPDPAGNSVTIAWKSAAGRVTTGVYTSAYVGASVAVLAATFLSFIGFYLVAGSVRRDRERGIGAILAATPLSKAAYLGGKLAAHAVYLLAVAGAALAAGLLAFARYGTGPLAAGDFLWPFLLLVVPAMAFVAALAVLFDVTPGLRGRGGLVLYFFVWSLGLIALPAETSGGMDDRRAPAGPPLFDPIGMVTFIDLVTESVPGSHVRDLSIGINVFDEPIDRVAWPGIRWRPSWVAARVGTLGWAAVPLAAAVVTFDRFDPARGGRRAGGRKRKKNKTRREEGLSVGTGVPVGQAAEAARTGAVRAGAAAGLAPLVTRPGPAQAVLAEARLVFMGAGPLRWPLVAAAVLAAVPGPVGMAGTAALFLLLAPVVSEVAARERLAGTAPLVFAQPAVPRSAALWKAAAVGVSVGALGAPHLLATAAFAPGRAFVFFCGLVFLAGAAVGVGSLTTGGKLFTAVYVVLWYLAVNGAPGLDFTGAFAPEPRLAAGAAFAAAGLAVLALASLVERRRTSVA